MHGIKFYSNNILAMTSRRSSYGIHFFEINSVDPILILKCGTNSVQDFCFISDNILAVISTTNSPKLYPQEMWSSHVDIIKFNLNNSEANLLNSLEIKNSHIYNVVFYNSNLYISDQYNNSILVVGHKDLIINNKYDGFDFPHGIDVRDGLLAVSNYGSNTVEIRNL